MERLQSHRSLCRTPVLAVSVLGGDADIMRTWRAGFSGHLVKPIDLDTLEAQFGRIFWAHHRAAPQPEVGRRER
jgi:DNA-binding response OmpR family regulator